MTKKANWFIPHQLGLDFIGGGTTTRGIDLIEAKSETPWQRLNLGLHVGDNPVTVAGNRNWIKSQLALPSEPFWLEQTHGVEVKEFIEPQLKPVSADASFSRQKDKVLVIMSADCLPIILASEDGNWIATVHCGWRSLASNILTKTLQKAPVVPSKIRAWLGPAIGPSAFEVSEDVKQAFIDKASEQQNSKEIIECCFAPAKTNKYFADLAQLATLQLKTLGLDWVKGGEFCTYSNPEQFFSYRRDGNTGRMATLAWIK